MFSASSPEFQGKRGDVRICLIADNTASVVHLSGDRAIPISFNRKEQAAEVHARPNIWAKLEIGSLARCILASGPVMLA
jgi:hypothetical protein